MFKGIIFIVLIAVIGLAIFYYFPYHAKTSVPEINTPNAKTIKIGDDVKLNVEIADDPGEQVKGLSDRDSLSQNWGMLFIFNPPSMPGFWMKDMRFSLDMIWINFDDTIVGIEKNVSPDTFPKTFSPPSPVKYVLEVNAGWSDRNRVKVGDVIELSK